jgi:hypothetical protein
MRNFLIAFAILASMGYAQQGSEMERNPPPSNDHAKVGPAAVARRLECVSWDPRQNQLIWFVSVWDLESDMSKPADLERYVIHTNSGVMERNGELRPFRIPEADLRVLTSILSSYAMRSTVWWERAAPDSDNTPDLVPDNKRTPQDKTGKDGPDDQPKAPPTGKAVVVRLLAPTSRPVAPEPVVVK